MERGRPGESYIIAGPTHTLIDALNVAQTITGVSAPRIHMPPAAMKTTAGLMSIVERVVPVPGDSAEYLRVRRHNLHRQQRQGAARARLRPSPTPRRAGRDAPARAAPARQSVMSLRLPGVGAPSSLPVKRGGGHRTKWRAWHATPPGLRHHAVSPVTPTSRRRAASASAGC